MDLGIVKDYSDKSGDGGSWERGDWEVGSFGGNGEDWGRGWKFRGGVWGD